MLRRAATLTQTAQLRSRSSTFCRPLLYTKHPRSATTVHDHPRSLFRRTPVSDRRVSPVICPGRTFLPPPLNIDTRAAKQRPHHEQTIFMKIPPYNDRKRVTRLCPTGSSSLQYFKRTLSFAQAQYSLASYLCTSARWILHIPAPPYHPDFRQPAERQSNIGRNNIAQDTDLYTIATEELANSATTKSTERCEFPSGESGLFAFHL